MLSLSGGFGSVIQALCTFSSLHPSVSAPLFFPPGTPAAAAALMPAAALPTLLAVVSDLYSVPASRCSFCQFAEVRLGHLLLLLLSSRAARGSLSG